MLVNRRKVLFSAVICGLLALGGLQPLHAEELKTARIVAGFPAGSSVDMLGRAVATELAGKWAENVIVENKPGASGQLGAVGVKGGPTDGSLLLITPMTVFGVFPHTFKDLPYDPIKDFTPVSNLASYNYGIAVGAAVPDSVQNLEQLVAWFKENPDKAILGNPAPGSSLHFAGELFGKAAGIEMTHAGYIGAQLFTDISSGVLPAGISTLGSLLPLHKAGRLRILATSGAERSPFLPDVGTFKEAGYNDLVFSEWIGLFAPAGTPDEVVNKINAMVIEALPHTRVQDIMKNFAQEATPSTPQELGDLVKGDMTDWQERVKVIGFTSAS